LQHNLKSSEVDILADGSLDYPDDLLKELDYTVCSIHSRCLRLNTLLQLFKRS
jgi:DNA polymerase (family 10)